MRIALASTEGRVALTATGDWRLSDRDGATDLLAAHSGDTWSIEKSGGRLRAVRLDGTGTSWRDGPLLARPTDSTGAALMTLNGRHYRGELSIAAQDTGLLIVNRLLVEDYLRGVVPLEIGTRSAGEVAAVEAQAVAARSYSYARMAESGYRSYDLVGTVLDQVYGGADVETPLTDIAVGSTGKLVLRFAGRLVNAPYSANCGGSTAAPSEVWQGAADQPYLQPVSDRIPGSDRYYCDIGPRFRWSRTLEGDALISALSRYARSVAAAGTPLPAGGAIRAITIDGRTPSGRVRALAVDTDRGRYLLRGNEIRFTMRSAGGEILNSTYFSVESEPDGDGVLARVIFRGTGNGHGIGMCQWGAIGRARAGQDYRTILRTYYPGTTIETVD
ncbi:MAG: SpoIID/LytB domain-containing protein [Gemmatimonadaceae bacterium]